MTREEIIHQGNLIEQAINNDPNRDGSDAIVIPAVKLLVSISLDLNRIADALESLATRHGSEE